MKYLLQLCILFTLAPVSLSADTGPFFGIDPLNLPNHPPPDMDSRGKKGITVLGTPSPTAEPEDEIVSLGIY